jgi:antitoxin component HigA of HigAB toxin-antitoxin module
MLETEEDYNSALADAETLMDAEPESPEENRLEKLTEFIEQYEREHYPI